jgi:hypothetical protein
MRTTLTPANADIAVETGIKRQIQAAKTIKSQEFETFPEIREARVFA